MALVIVFLTMIAVGALSFSEIIANNSENIMAKAIIPFVVYEFSFNIALWFCGKPLIKTFM